MTRSRLGVAVLAAILTGACGGDDSPSTPTPVSNGGGPSTTPPPSGCSLPPAPANLRVTLKMQSLVELSWDAVAGATSYTLLVGGTATSADILSADMSQTSFRYAARDGRQYARVQARTACGAGAIANAIEFSVP